MLQIVGAIVISILLLSYLPYIVGFIGILLIIVTLTLANLYLAATIPGLWMMAACGMGLWYIAKRVQASFDEDAGETVLGLFMTLPVWGLVLAGFLGGAALVAREAWVALSG